MDILPPYDDRVFKRVLTAPEAVPALIFVASAILECPVRSVLVRNSELSVAGTEEKAERFDVNCVIDDHTQADIEMQAVRMKEERDAAHSNLKARSIYNLCDLHSSQPSKGKPYGALIRTYQVMFCGYTVFPGRSAFANYFSMRHDEDNELLHDAVRILFVELSKAKSILEKPVEQMTDLERLSVFLRYAERSEHRETVNKILQSREGLTVAGEVLMSISKDERERAILRSRRIYQADLESDLATSKNIGRAEGRAEGRVEGRAEGRAEMQAEMQAEMARKLLGIRMPAGTIAEVTGLSVAEVERLRSGM
jgi:predicted transposase/invertase (TIGR01784 family)